MGTRHKNEKKYDRWIELPGGGRLYELELRGVQTGSARYKKQVDAREVTIRFWQEIFDEEGKLVEVHEKFPEDTGHV